jgi:hypothetical protein
VTANQYSVSSQTGKFVRRETWQSVAKSLPENPVSSQNVTLLNKSPVGDEIDDTRLGQVLLLLMNQGDDHDRPPASHAQHSVSLTK